MSNRSHEILGQIFEKYGHSVWDCELRTICIELLNECAHYELGGYQETILHRIDDIILDLVEWRSAFSPIKWHLMIKGGAK